MALQAPDNSGFQAFINSGFQVRGGGLVIWFSDSNTDLLTSTVGELSYADLSILRSAAAPYYPSHDIGGTRKTLLLVTFGGGTPTEQHRTRLNPLDFSVIVDITAPYASPAGWTGIGGYNSLGYLAYQTGVTMPPPPEIGIIWTFDSTTLILTGGSFSAKGPTPRGIDGDASTIWHQDALSVYDYNTHKCNSGFTTLQWVNSPETRTGIGGGSRRCYSTRAYFVDSVYTRYAAELSIEDLSVIRSVEHPWIYGIGGK